MSNKNNQQYIAQLREERERLREQQRALELARMRREAAERLAVSTEINTPKLNNFVVLHDMKNVFVLPFSETWLETQDMMVDFSAVVSWPWLPYHRLTKR